MSAISLKSITGITSITTPAGIDNQLTLHTNNTIERLRITSDGKIGINTTAPSTQLQIVGSTASVDSSGGTLGIRQKGDSKSDGITLTSSHANSARFWKDSDGALHIYNTGGNVNDFVLTNVGKVGISTNNPSYTLDVRADNFTKAVFQGTGSNSSNIPFYIMSGDSACQIGNHPSGQEETIIFNSANNFISFETADTERLRIHSDGKVLVGTNTGTAKLEISDAIGQTGEEVLLKLQGRATKNVYLDINADANRRGVIRFKSAGTDKWSIGRGDSDELTDSSFFIASGNSGGNTAKFVIDSNGDVGINETNPTQKLHVGGSIKLTAQIMQSMPADYWAQGNTFIELSGLGNLTHMGSYETCLTSNGYRNSSTQWTSYAINSTTGASQIRLNPTGFIAFGTESNKANGSTHTVTERLRILSTGRIEQMNNNEDIDMDSNASGQLKLDGNGYNAALALNAQGLNIYTNSGTRGIIFGTDEDEKVRITSDGKLLVGKTSGSAKVDIDASNSTLRLTKANATDYVGFQLDRDNSNNAGGYLGLAGSTSHYISGSAQHDLCLRSQSNLLFSTNGNVERLRIDTSGNVLIGTGTATAEFVVRGGGTVAAFEGTGGSGAIAIRDADAGTYVFLKDDGGVFHVQTSGSSYSDKFSILTNGNTGINQTNPNKAKLHVVADSGSTDKIVAKFRNPQGSADAKAKIGFVAGYSDTANDTEGQAYIGAQREGSGNNAALFFQTSDGSTLSERLRIQSNGTIKLSKDGTTVGDNSSGVLIIGRHNSGNEGGEISMCRANDNTAYWHFDCYGSGNTPRLRLHRAGAERFNFYDNGNFAATGSVSSDRDLKEDIQTVTGTSIDKIIQLTPKTYKFIGNDTPHAGFIAQEVKEVWPSLVNGTDGNKDMGVDYNGIVAHLVNCVKELKAENDSLKSRVTTLEGS